MKKLFVYTGVGALVVAAAALFVSTAPQASNAIFKIEYALYAAGAALPGGGSSASGTNSLCLPYLRKSGLQMASDLAADIDAQAGGAVVDTIARFRVADGGEDVYDGSAPSDFALTAGEELRVVVSQSTTYTILGSHDPGRSILLLGADDPGSLNGENAFCPPFHTRSADAAGLLDEIGSAAGDSSVVSSIGRFLRSSDTIESYTGSSTVTNFTITPGEGYRRSVQRTVDIIPEHR